MAVVVVIVVVVVVVGEGQFAIAESLKTLCSESFVLVTGLFRCFVGCVSQHDFLFFISFLYLILFVSLYDFVSVSVSVVFGAQIEIIHYVRAIL